MKTYALIFILGLTCCDDGSELVDDTGQIRPGGVAKEGNKVFPIEDGATIAGLVYGVDDSYMALVKSADGESKVVVGTLGGTAARGVCPALDFDPGMTPPVVIGSVPGSLCEGFTFPDNLSVRPTRGNIAAMKLDGDILSVFQGSKIIKCNLETEVASEIVITESIAGKGWLTETGMEYLNVDKRLSKTTHTSMSWDGEVVATDLMIDPATDLYFWNNADEVRPFVRVNDDYIIGHYLFNSKTKDVSKMFTVGDATLEYRAGHIFGKELNSKIGFSYDLGTKTFTQFEGDLAFSRGSWYPVEGGIAVDAGVYKRGRGGYDYTRPHATFGDFKTKQITSLASPVSGSVYNSFKKFCKVGIREGKPIVTMTEELTESASENPGPIHDVVVPEGSTLKMPNYFGMPTIGLDGTCLAWGQYEPTGQERDFGPWGLVSFDCNDGSKNNFLTLSHNWTLLTKNEEEKWASPAVQSIFEGSAILAIGDQDEPTCDPVDSDTFSVYRIEKDQAIPLANDAKKYWIRDTAKQPFLVQKADGLYLVK